jgi:hypothetical protein
MPRRPPVPDIHTQLTRDPRGARRPTADDGVRHSDPLNRKDDGMSEDTNNGSGRGRRRAGVLGPVAGIALLAAACGGSPAAGTGSGIHQTAYQRELAYAECMRAHGLPGFPDPQSDGTFNSTRANAGDFHGPRFLSANKACAHLEGPGMSLAQQQQQTDQFLRFAACMRAHGITGFQYNPPKGGSEGGLGAPVGSPGADPNSPQFQSAARACRKLQPSAGPRAARQGIRTTT